MSQYLQPRIVVLRDGTGTEQGAGVVTSNVNACQAIVDMVRTTLGPRGMDKLICNNATGAIMITNDGATVMKTLNVVHPAARTLVEIAKAQDAEVGDGTTSVVILAGELLTEAKRFVEEGVPQQIIIKAYRKALELARKKILEMAIPFDKNSDKAREFLENCAATSMQSKLIAHQRDYFKKLVVDAVQHLDENLDIDMIGVKKEPGGALQDSFLVEGVAFKKNFLLCWI
eukprot:TRINITY_DN837_c0_g1_i3.p1 TRINITY_DN837_c0_g1~~TRINITY_DN837_c0_g1_i3.p1  ORF type:complete len:239 (+),score=66.43 TRINITY_DN837_c0_g1_i3:31-717(+)